MTFITALGLASLIFVAAFTARAYRNNSGTGQTPRGAIAEAWINIMVGFSFNYALNFMLLPQLGAQLTLANNFWLGWIYTAASICRQYAIRRWFNARIHRVAARLAKETP